MSGRYWRSYEDYVVSYSLQQVDLYVSEIRVDRDWLNFQLLIKALGVLAVVMAVWTAGLVWSIYSSKSEAQMLAKQLDQAKKQLEEFGMNVENSKKNNADLPTRIEAARKDLQNKQKLLSYLGTQKTDQEKGFSALLTSLAMQTTPGAWLTRIAVTGSGKSMQLEGKTIDPNSVPGYLKKLAQEASIAGRNFDVMTFDRDKKNAQLVNFLLRSGDPKGFDAEKSDDASSAEQQSPASDKKESSISSLLSQATAPQQ